VSPFVNATYAGYDVPADSYPKFITLIEQVKAQPSVAMILAKEAKALGFA
jgi:glutathione S-transferase